MKKIKVNELNDKLPIKYMSNSKWTYNFLIVQEEEEEV